MNSYLLCWYQERNSRFTFESLCLVNVFFSSVAYWHGDHVLLNSCITAIRERCRLTLCLMSPRFGFIKVLYQVFYSSWNFCQTYIHIQIHTYATGIGLRLGLSLSSPVGITTIIRVHTILVRIFTML